MKFARIILAPIALFASLAAMAGPALPHGVLAQLTISGGFMAPGMSNTTHYQIDSNGTVSVSTYRGRDFGPAQQETHVIGKISNVDLNQLENAISALRAGQLVDQNPAGPIGADFPNKSYVVQNAYGQTLEIAARRGDGKFFALQQRAALAIQKFMDNTFFPVHTM